MNTTFEIEHPDKKTYWIFWTDKITKFVYGSTDTKQITNTNHANQWTTTDEAEWLYKLKTEFNTIINKENDNSI